MLWLNHRVKKIDVTSNDEIITNDMNIVHMTSHPQCWCPKLVLWELFSNVNTFKC